MALDPRLEAALALSFAQAIAFFRAKLNLPTDAWDDIWQEAHDRAFVVAGATAADLLADLRQAVDKAISTGTTLEQFRRDFRDIVARRGWTGWTGEGTRAGEAWRTRVIYETNLRTSYAAGRWAQLTDPALLQARPWWRYIHSDSVLNPRPHHKRWGDMRLTLRHDHPWWRTHYPPNGWGCRCRVVALSEDNLAKSGIKVESSSGKLGSAMKLVSEKTGEMREVATYRATDPATRREIVFSPDVGWSYNPGAAAWQPDPKRYTSDLAKLARKELP